MEEFASISDRQYINYHDFCYHIEKLGRRLESLGQLENVVTSNAFETFKETEMHLSGLASTSTAARTGKYVANRRYSRPMAHSSIDEVENLESNTY